jgi:hypothetical protein
MMLLAPVTNWEPHAVTLAGYCYAMRHGMKVQIVTPYLVSHFQRYGATARGNHHATTHNTPIRNILSTAPQLSISQKALGKLPKDGNVMPKHVGATIHN